MMKMKRLLALTLSLALSISLLAGCGGDTSSSSSASSSTDSSALNTAIVLDEVVDPYLATAGIASDTVVATVGEYEITADMFLYWLYYSYSYVLQDYLLSGESDIPWEEMDTNGVTLEEVLKENALLLSAYYCLLPELGQKEGIPVNEELAASLATDYDNVQDALGSKHLADAYFWANLMTNDLFQRLYMAGETNNDLQNLYFGEGTDGYPTDAEVLEYAENMGYYHAKHILLKTVDTTKSVSNDDGTYGYAPLDETTVAEKGALAEELLEQIQNADDPVAKFNELMNTHSEDEGLATNPDGYITYSGTMVEEFENAARSLDEGEISGLVTSPLGYHIIQRLPLDPADFRAEMIAERMEDKSDEWLDEYGVETTDAYLTIDAPTYCSRAIELQNQAYAAVNDAIANMQSTNEDASSEE